MRAELIGGPAPYREAIENRLMDRGFDVGPVVDCEVEESRRVAVVYCEDDRSWETLGTLAAEIDCIAVAVLPSLTLDLYVRALFLGAAGVVYIDTPSEAAVDLVVAAVAGEVRLPRQAAQSIAALARREEPPSDLDEYERRLLSEVASGTTIVTLADQLHYSERTVRRHLHGLYLKLGVKNRSEAITRAARLGLTD
jgi:DNA-binding NarL/FixJ family response regulator